MTTLTYNGIYLGVLRTVQFSKDVVLDGPNYLWTKVTITVDGVYNANNNAVWANSVLAPGTLGSSSSPVANTIIPGTNIDNPVFTDQAIRQVLLTPRQKLVYGIGNQSLLTCPAGNDLTDANNGPLPQSVEVHRIHGTKTWFVKFTVVCFINEAFNLTTTPPLILSHLWTEGVHYDRDFFPSRIRKGRAIVNQAALLAFAQSEGFSPQVAIDAFRLALMPQISTGYKRGDIKVEVSPDQSTLTYEVTDDFQSSLVDDTFYALGVTRIEGSVGYGHSFGTLNSVNLGTLVGQGLETAAVARGAAGRSAGVAGLLIGMMGSAGIQYTNASYVTVKVWGDQQSQRQNLYACARTLLVSVIGNAAIQGVQPNNGGSLAGMAEKAAVEWDALGRYVELTMTIIGFPFADRAGTLGSALDDLGQTIIQQVGAVVLSENVAEGGMSQGRVKAGPNFSLDVVGLVVQALNVNTTTPYSGQTPPASNISSPEFDLQ